MILIGFKIPIEMFQNANRKVYNIDYVYKVSDVDRKFEGGNIPEIVHVTLCQRHSTS